MRMWSWSLSRNMALRHTGHVHPVDLHPKLLSAMEVTDWYKTVVMEDLPNTTVLSSYRDSEEKQRLLICCKEASEELHKQGFFHRDFQPNNILVLPDETRGRDIWIIDFDWLGKTGEQRYPLFVNHIDLQWHPSASDGLPLEKRPWLDKCDVICVNISSIPHCCVVFKLTLHDLSSAPCIV